MRLRRGGSDRLIRRFAAGTVLLVALLLGGRYIVRAFGSIPRNSHGKSAIGSIVEGDGKTTMEGIVERNRQLIKAGGQWLVEVIWNQAHPGDRLTEEEYGQDDRTGPADPDPSYRKYQAVRTFYQEHQYLAWYGNEESGQQTPEETESAGQLASASGQESQNSGQGGQGSGQEGQSAGPEEAAAGSLDGNAAVQTSGTLTGTMNRPITGNTYVMEQLADYDYLMKHFYSVHTSTTAGRDLMDAKELLGRDMSMKGDNSKPQILIYHTHSQEAFADSGPGQTVVGVGDYLTTLLEGKGYNVYHDKSVYDLKNGQLDRSKAYNYALDGIANILQQNPSIEVVLDIHRDGVGENLHLVTQVDGKDTAQIMFFNGMSQTPEGPIEYLQNPYREDNLAFSLQMQLDAAAYYPGYTRKIYLKGLRYNEHLRPKSSLIEVGAQTNTYQEALNAMEPLSELLDMVLSGEKP